MYSKVQDLFIDIQHELKNLKQGNVVVSAPQQTKPVVKEVNLVKLKNLLKKFL